MIQLQIITIPVHVSNIYKHYSERLWRKFSFIGELDDKGKTQRERRERNSLSSGRMREDMQTLTLRKEEE